MRTLSSLSLASTRSAGPRAEPTLGRRRTDSGRPPSPGAGKRSKATAIDAFALESSLNWNDWTLFGRGEMTENNELVVEHDEEGDHHGEAFRVGKISVGLLKEFAIGAQSEARSRRALRLQFRPRRNRTGLWRRSQRSDGVCPVEPGVGCPQSSKVWRNLSSFLPQARLILKRKASWGELPKCPENFAQMLAPASLRWPLHYIPHLPLRRKLSKPLRRRPSRRRNPLSTKPNRLRMPTQVTIPKSSSPPRSAPKMSRTCRFRSRLFPATRSRRTTSSTSRAWRKITPNLSVAKGAQTSYVRLAIRGIGAASNTTVEPSVAVFLDGAYVPRVGAVISSMLDMESVEVLRGPQGTLFGRNASVGAVSFHTARPEVRRLVGRSDRRDRQRRPLQGLRLRQRAGRRQCGVPLRRVAAMVQGLLAQRARRQAGRRDRRHHPARQLPRRNRAGRMDLPRRLREAQRRRRDQHRLRPRQRFGRAVDILHQRRRLGAPDTDLNDRT